MRIIFFFYGSPKERAVKGFTVIELVTIIAIITILTVYAIPRFFSTLAYNQQMYYDQVLNSLRYARKLAVGAGTHVQVNVTATSIMVRRRIEGSNCAAATFGDITDPGTTTTGYTKIAPGTVTLNFSANFPIYFDALGQAYTASNCTVIGTATVGVVGGKTATVIGPTGFTQ